MTWCDLRSLPGFVVVLGLVGCSSPEGLQRAGPTVTKLATIVLQETESLFVSQPDEVGITRGGDIVVGDASAQRVIQFDSGGRWIRVFGRKGRGPGEFSMMGKPVPLDNGLLGISDEALRRLQLFDLQTGELRRVISNLPTVRGIKAAGDVVWFTTMVSGDSTDGGTSTIPPRTLARLDLASGGMRFGGSLPVAFTLLEPLAGPHWTSPLTVTHDGILVGVSGLDSLILYSTTDLKVLRSVRLPAVRRRQADPDITELRKAFDGQRPPAESWKSASFLVGLHALASGEIVVLHMDQDLVGQSIVSRPFVSLVSADLTSACVDTPVPLPSDARIASALGYNRIVLLTQEARGDRVQATAHVFTVSSTGCTWIALE